MCTVTELVFWNEQAMYIFGLNWSSAQRSASSALASSSSAAIASGSKSSAPGMCPFWPCWTAVSVAVGSIRSLDGALALAAPDLVRLGPVPVDEVHEVVGAELDGELQIGDQLLELLDARALDVLVEVLAVVPLLLVGADPALDRFGNALRGKPRLEPPPEGDLAALEVPGDVGDVGGDGVVAHLDRGPVEADRGDVVLGAAVRAPAHLDVDLLGERIGDLHLLDALLKCLVEA